MILIKSDEFYWMNLYQFLLIIILQVDNLTFIKFWGIIIIEINREGVRIWLI